MIRGHVASNWIFSLWVYAIPVPLVAALGVAWFLRTRSTPFTIYVLSVPLVYGYVMPFVATRCCRMWQFKGKMVWGTIYVHHGFKYAASLSLFLFLASAGLSRLQSPSIVAYASVAISTAFSYAFITWVHDIQLVKQGIAHIHNQPARKGKSPEEIVSWYAPFSFATIGLCYAIGSLISYEVFVVRRWTTMPWVASCFLLGLILLFGPPSIVYYWLNQEGRIVS